MVASVNRQVVLSLTPKQAEFADAVFSERYRYLLFGGAIKGGKSFCGITIIITLARLFPGSRWAIVRKDLPTLRRNTVPIFERIRPRNFVGELNRSIWIAKCANESEILFFPETIKGDPDLDRWKGLDVNGFLLEEVNELSRASFNKSIERAGAWKVPGEHQPPVLVLMTCNPAKNYIKQLFYDPWRAGDLSAPYFYLPAKVTDNPHLTQEYLSSLEQLRVTDPKAYERFVEGNWETADDPDQLIKFEWVMGAKDVDHQPGKMALGVDVARYGDDDTVLCHVDGNAITMLEYHHGLAIDRTASIVQTRIGEGPIDAGNVKVDTVGLGGGVADILRREGFNVTDIESGSAAHSRTDSFYRFRNLRSQMWWDLREKLRSGEICINIDDHRLVEDLTAPRYRVSSDKVLQVESKDEIKRRIGRSTDAGDAVVYAFADVGGARGPINLSDAGARQNPWGA